MCQQYEFNVITVLHSRGASLLVLINVAIRLLSVYIIDRSGVVLLLSGAMVPLLLAELTVLIMLLPCFLIKSRRIFFACSLVCTLLLEIDL